MRMKHDAIVKRRATNVYLSEEDVVRAKQLEVNISRACEAGLRRAVSTAAAQRWEEENRSAIDGWNRWIEKNGSPLDKYRAF